MKVVVCVMYNIMAWKISDYCFERLNIAGCMFHSERGLMSFEHPMHKMKAMPRVDSEGVMCGSNFKVDALSKINSIPRVGSEANWATWGHQA